MKKLSIVIPVYNEKNTILKVLDNLEKLTLPYKYEKEIILANAESHRFAISYHRSKRTIK
jgi:glycosyltransferase involved in cell wall biosynthesis